MPDADFNTQRLDILAVNWVVIKQSEVGFRRRIYSAILARNNLDVSDSVH